MSTATSTNLIVKAPGLMKFEFAICAESFIRDATSDRLTAVNILEDLGVDGFPFLFPQIACVFVLRQEPNDSTLVDVDFRVSLDGQLVSSTAAKIDFRSARRFRAFFQLQGIVIPKPSGFLLELMRNGIVIAEWAFEVGAPKPAVI